MTRWHRTRRGDLGLRAVGLGILALSCLFVGALVHLRDADPAHWTPGVFAYVLTAAGFVSGSMGAALTLLGAHLFDGVQVSERWRVKPRTEREVGAAASTHSRPVAQLAPEVETSPAASSLVAHVPARVASFRRFEDRGGLVPATMMPMVRQGRR